MGHNVLQTLVFSWKNKIKLLNTRRLDGHDYNQRKTFSPLFLQLDGVQKKADRPLERASPSAEHDGWISITPERKKKTRECERPNRHHARKEHTLAQSLSFFLLFRTSFSTKCTAFQNHTFGGLLGQGLSTFAGNLIICHRSSSKQWMDTTWEPAWPLGPIPHPIGPRAQWAGRTSAR